MYAVCILLCPGVTCASMLPCEGVGDRHRLAAAEAPVVIVMAHLCFGRPVCFSIFCPTGGICLLMLAYGMGHWIGLRAMRVLMVWCTAVGPWCPHICA
jgi:hypothetical protein